MMVMSAVPVVVHFPAVCVFIHPLTRLPAREEKNRGHGKATIHSHNHVRPLFFCCHCMDQGVGHVLGLPHDGRSVLKGGREGGRER